MLVTADAYKAVADALKSAAIDDAKGRLSFAILNITGDDDGRRALVAGDDACKQAAAATATSPKKKSCELQIRYTYQNVVR